MVFRDILRDGRLCNQSQRVNTSKRVSTMRQSTRDESEPVSNGITNKSLSMEQVIEWKSPSEFQTSYDYATNCFDRAKKLYDVGTQQKSNDLGNTLATKIDTRLDVFQNHDECVKDGIFHGYATAMIPILREQFKIDESINTHSCSNEENLVKIDDKLINEGTLFAIVTTRDLRHIPNMQVSFPDESGFLLRDLLVFRNLSLQ